MFDLDYSQQEAIGLTFIFNQLTPNSPYGVERKKQIAPFSRGEKAALSECFDNIEKISELNNSDVAGLDELEFQLMSLKQIHGIVLKCENHTLSQVELFELKQFLLTFEKLEVAFRKLHERVCFAGIDLIKLGQALDILDPERKRIAAFVLDSPELCEIRREKGHVEAQLQKEKLQSGESVLTTKRIELVRREAEEETKVMSSLTARLRPCLPSFTANIDNIGKLDLFIAKAKLALMYGAVRPKISERAEVSLKSMFNPFAADALEKNNQTMTRVSMTLPKGTTIITGANMGGKTVAVKTAVLNIVLCQMGFFVFAESAEIPIFDGVCLISEDMQDIGRGLSSFGAEIARFNEISGRMKSEFLFIAMDEFARGTNPEEGAPIVRAIASYLSESGSVCVMTTHYDRVVSPKFKHYQVAGLNLPESSQESGYKIPSIAQYMDYNLIETGYDTSPPRDALNICKVIGLNDDILNRIGAEYDSLTK